MKHVTLPESDIGLSEASLPAASFLLRHRELWPRNFNEEWDYTWCKSCARGLIIAQWGGNKYINSDADLARLLNTSEKVVRVLTMMVSTIMEKCKVQPEDVANVIDRYLAGNLNVESYCS